MSSSAGKESSGPLDPSPVGRVKILAQRQPVDEALFDEFAAAEADTLGLTVDVQWVDDLSGVLDAARAALRERLPLVVVPAPGTPDLAELPAEVAPWTVRVDLSLVRTDTSPGLLTHIQGRGIDGVRWALRTIHHRSRWASHTIGYGNQRDQYGVLRLPERREERAPVVVVLHGGFWRSRWQLDLMDALSVDLAERGLASWNVEYRPPDRFGWAATVADVTAAVAQVARLAEEFPLDPTRVALVGHSAGGQLAVQVAADAGGENRPALVVQLAGLVDLLETHRRDLGNGAVPTALGGTPDEIPDVYAQASPLQRVPLGVPQLVVVGRSDSPDLREMSRRYVATAEASGDEVELIEDDGDHFTVIDPTSRIWGRTVEAIAAAVSR
jgi:acetyl esterase/lipase